MTGQLSTYNCDRTVVSAYVYRDIEGTESMVVYQCEDTLESIFTAIYNAYEEHRDHGDTRISLTDELLLFGEYVPITVDQEKVMKVIRTLKRRFGEADYQSVCFALSSPEPDKAQAVYRTIVKGLEGKVRPGHLLDNLADDDCNKVFTLARAASRENHHLYGFLRFEEVQNGILFAKIGPKNHLLTFLMPHFADRFPMENFVIYDDKRKLFGVHPAGREWYLVKGEEDTPDTSAMEMSEKEQMVQDLFCCFCHTIAIRERDNKKLQQNMLPLRFREYMTEF